MLSFNPALPPAVRPIPARKSLIAPAGGVPAAGEQRRGHAHRTSLVSPPATSAPTVPVRAVALTPKRRLNTHQCAAYEAALERANLVYYLQTVDLDA